MKILDYSNYSRLVAYGDIHGEFTRLMYDIKNNVSHHKDEEIKKPNRPLKISLKKKNNRTDLENSIIIVAGDISLGFNKLEYYNQNLKSLNELLNINNSHLLFIRGNHDDPSYFHEKKIDFSNIHAIDDYTVVLTQNHKTLCVGGAISLDRSWRITREAIMNKYSSGTNKKKIYWENEPFAYDENSLIEFKENHVEIDSVITHTYPRVDRIYAKQNQIEYWSENDETLITDLKKETEDIINLYNYLINNFKITFWACGHEHVNNTFKYNDISFIQMSNDYYYKDIDGIINSLNVKPNIESLKDIAVKYAPYSNHTVTWNDPFEGLETTSNDDAEMDESEDTDDDSVVELPFQQRYQHDENGVLRAVVENNDEVRVGTLIGEINANPERHYVNGTEVALHELEALREAAFNRVTAVPNDRIERTNVRIEAPF